MSTLYVADNAAGGGDGSMGNPMTIDEAVAMISVDGNTIRMKAGAYMRLVGLDIKNNLLIGCKSDWSIPTLWEPPQATIEYSGAVGAPLITSASTSGARIRHLDLGYVTGANDMISTAGGSLRALRCRMRDIGRSAVAAGDGVQLMGCEITDWGTNAAAPAVNVASKHAAALIGNYIHDGVGTGVTLTSSIGSIAEYNVIAGCSQAGILATYAVADRPTNLAHNIFYNNESGVQFGSTSLQPIISRGNLYLASSTYGVRYNGSGAPLLVSIGDGFHGNTSGEVSPLVNVEELLARYTLAGSPLVDPAGGDFRLKAAIDLRRAGWPDMYLAAGDITARWAYLAAGLPPHGPAAKGGRVFGGMGG